MTCLHIQTVPFRCRFCAKVFINREQLSLSYAKSKKEAKRRAAEEATLAMMAYEKVIGYGRCQC